MSEDKVHDLFPASCRLASTDVKGMNTIEQWKATLDRYAKSSFKDNVGPLWKATLWKATLGRLRNVTALYEKCKTGHEF